MIAAARLDLPTIFVTGGPMLPGHATDPATGAEREIILSDVKEAMGRYKAGASPGAVLRDRMQGVRRAGRVRVHGHRQHE